MDLIPIQFSDLKVGQPLSWDFHNNIMYLQASKGSDGNMQGTYQMNLGTGKATLVGEPYDKQVITMVIPDLDAKLSHLSVDGVAVSGFRPVGIRPFSSKSFL